MHVYASVPCRRKEDGNRTSKYRSFTWTSKLKSIQMIRSSTVCAAASKGKHAFHGCVISDSSACPCVRTCTRAHTHLRIDMNFHSLSKKKNLLRKGGKEGTKRAQKRFCSERDVNGQCVCCTPATSVVARGRWWVTLNVDKVPHANHT